MSDDLFLTRPEIKSLSIKLRELRDWVCADLDDTVCRQVAFGERGDRRAETPVVFNVNASEVAHNVLGTLRSWTEHVCVHSTCEWPGEQRAQQFAAWLDRHLIDLAKTEEANTAADELTDAWKQAKKAIDRPVPQEFVGPCQSDTPGVECEGVYCQRGADTKQCGTCDLVIDIPVVKSATEAVMHDHLFTKKDLRQAMMMYLNTTVPRQVVDNWVRRGRLADHAGKYKLDEALSLWSMTHRKAS